MNLTPSQIPICAICLDQIIPQNHLNDFQVVRLHPSSKISHVFHFDCFNEWFYYNQTCPICRGILTDRSIQIIQSSGYLTPLIKWMDDITIKADNGDQRAQEFLRETSETICSQRNRIRIEFLYATECGDISILAILIANNSSILSETFLHDTLLSAAIQTASLYGHLNVVKFLFENNTKPLSDESLNSAIMKAREEKHSAIVEYLSDCQRNR